MEHRRGHTSVLVLKQNTQATWIFKKMITAKLVALTKPSTTKLVTA